MVELLATIIIFFILTPFILIIVGGIFIGLDEFWQALWNDTPTSTPVKKTKQQKGFMGYKLVVTKEKRT